MSARRRYSAVRQPRARAADSPAASRGAPSIIASTASRMGGGRSAAKVARYEPRNEQRVVFGDTIFVERLNTPAVEFIRAHAAGW